MNQRLEERRRAAMVAHCRECDDALEAFLNPPNIIRGTE